MFQRSEQPTRLSTGFLLVFLMLLAAAPPTALILMQREASEPRPYLIIDVSGDPQMMAPEAFDSLQAASGS